MCEYVFSEMVRALYLFINVWRPPVSSHLLQLCRMQLVFDSKAGPGKASMAESDKWRLSPPLSGTCGNKLILLIIFYGLDKCTCIWTRSIDCKVWRSVVDRVWDKAPSRDVYWWHCNAHLQLWTKEWCFCSRMIRCFQSDTVCLLLLL